MTSSQLGRPRVPLRQPLYQLVIYERAQSRTFGVWPVYISVGWETLEEPAALFPTTCLPPPTPQESSWVPPALCGSQASHSVSWDGVKVGAQPILPSQPSVNRGLMLQTR